MYVKIVNLADYSIYNINTGRKHLQTHLNVLAQLLARMNATIALLIAPNIIALLISPIIPRSSLYNSTMFPSLKWPLLLKIQFLQTIPLLNLYLFISMDSNIIIFLHTWPKLFRI